mmetsp:Transcript_9564/g.23374  ORF Transcript_9564/g.23374 Transcript_9564/m.23374 type:complete len:85 (+) Transcript_9564:62-316(+)
MELHHAASTLYNTLLTISIGDTGFYTRVALHEESLCFLSGFTSYVKVQHVSGLTQISISIGNIQYHVHTRHTFGKQRQLVVWYR